MQPKYDLSPTAECRHGAKDLNNRAKFMDGDDENSVWHLTFGSGESAYLLVGWDLGNATTFKPVNGHCFEAASVGREILNSLKCRLLSKGNVLLIEPPDRPPEYKR